MNEIDPSKGGWCPTCGPDVVWLLHEVMESPTQASGKYLCPHGWWFERTARELPELAPGMRRLNPSTAEPVFRVEG